MRAFSRSSTPWSVLPSTRKARRNTNTPYVGDFPRGFEYFERLADFINYETVSREDFAMRGMLAGIGIVKGQPFEPDAKMKALLDKAGQVGFKMAAAVDYDYRPMPKIYPDRNWEQVFIGGSPVFEAETYRNLDALIAFVHKAYSTSNAMVIAMPGRGPNTCSAYAIQTANTSLVRIPTAYIFLPTCPPPTTGR